MSILNQIFDVLFPRICAFLIKIKFQTHNVTLNFEHAIYWLELTYFTVKQRKAILAM